MITVIPYRQDAKSAKKLYKSWPAWHLGGEKTVHHLVDHYKNW